VNMIEWLISNSEAQILARIISRGEIYFPEGSTSVEECE